MRTTPGPCSAGRGAGDLDLSDLPGRRATRRATLHRELHDPVAAALTDRDRGPLLGAAPGPACQDQQVQARSPGDPDRGRPAAAHAGSPNSPSCPRHEGHSALTPSRVNSTWHEAQCAEWAPTQAGQNCGSVCVEVAGFGAEQSRHVRDGRSAMIPGNRSEALTVLTRHRPSPRHRWSADPTSGSEAWSGRSCSPR